MAGDDKIGDHYFYVFIAAKHEYIYAYWNSWANLSFSHAAFILRQSKFYAHLKFVQTGHNLSVNQTK